MGCLFPFAKNRDDINKEQNQTSKRIAILVVGHNISKSEEHDDKEIKCFKNLIDNQNFDKIILLEQRKIRNFELFKNVKKLTIFIFDQDTLISSDYSNQKQVY